MNLTIKNNLGEQLNVISIRYFKFNGSNYLIFTKNEVDESGYQKLYISKIVNEVGNTIADEIEWNLVRDTIKVIARANKENTTLPVQDMNESEINGIQINGQKPFKLTSSSVALLSANKNAQSLMITNQVPTQPVNQVNPAQNFSSISAPTDLYNIQPNVAQNIQPQATNTPEVPLMPEINISTPANVIPPIQASVIPNTVNSSLDSSNFQNSVVNNSISNPTIPNLNDNLLKNPSLFSYNENSFQDLQTKQPNVPVQPATEIPLVESVQPSVVVPPVVSVQQAAPAEMVDYKKLYEDQTLKLNALTVELDKYKSILEQLKNILD